MSKKVQESKLPTSAIIDPAAKKAGLELKSGAELQPIIDGNRVINPHVPLFIKKTPWYSTEEHTVKAVKKMVTDPMDKWYYRIITKNISTWTGRLTLE